MVTKLFYKVSGQAHPREAMSLPHDDQRFFRLPEAHWPPFMAKGSQLARAHGLRQERYLASVFTDPDASLTRMSEARWLTLAGHNAADGFAVRAGSGQVLVQGFKFRSGADLGPEVWRSVRRASSYTRPTPPPLACR
jgi:hypothetical protein